MDQLAKARTRFWNMPSASIRQIPFVALLIGSFFFVGLSPFASGTVGSAIAALLYYVLPVLQNNWILFGLCIIVLVSGTSASNRILLYSKEHDPGIIVIDEVVGQWLALLTTVYSGDLVFVIGAFLFFRIFDVLKVYPATYFERSRGGAAVMLDDVVAGVYANIAAHVATYGYYHFLA